jgi:hypothetical protein
MSALKNDRGTVDKTSEAMQLVPALEAAIPGLFGHGGIVPAEGKSAKFEKGSV